MSGVDQAQEWLTSLRFVCVPASVTVAFTAEPTQPPDSRESAKLRCHRRRVGGALADPDLAKQLGVVRQEQFMGPLVQRAEHLVRTDLLLDFHLGKWFIPLRQGGAPLVRSGANHPGAACEVVNAGIPVAPTHRAEE